MSNANPNSNQDRLNLYIHQRHQRLRLGVSLRGVAILTATALITTVFLVLILNRFAFPVRGLTGARSLLLIVIACAAGLALALPLVRLTRRRATVVAESAHPEFQQRLLTFDDREKKGDDPFLKLLAADTLSVARAPRPAPHRVPARPRGSRARLRPTDDAASGGHQKRVRRPHRGYGDGCRANGRPRILKREALAVQRLVGSPDRADVAAAETAAAQTLAVGSAWRGRRS